MKCGCGSKLGQIAKTFGDTLCDRCGADKSILDALADRTRSLANDWNWVGHDEDRMQVHLKEIKSALGKVEAVLQSGRKIGS